MAFAVISAARLPLLPPSRAGPLTTLQASLHAADRIVAPPKGLLTLGFDPDRFQPEPPVCYRASWQLPGPDSHRQATTSTNNKITPTSRGHLPFHWAHGKASVSSPSWLQESLSGGVYGCRDFGGSAKKRILA